MNVKLSLLVITAAVGIAAPQVGHFQRIVIIDCSTTRKPVPNHGHLILVNPEITHWEGYEPGREGCLSVPDYTGNVVRAERIRLRAQDRHGNDLAFDMDGFEAVEAIKSNPATATIPIMMYTSKGGDLYVSQARALGAIGILPKQVQPAELFTVLENLGLVKNRRARLPIEGSNFVLRSLATRPLMPEIQGLLQ